MDDHGVIRYMRRRPATPESSKATNLFGSRMLPFDNWHPSIFYIPSYSPIPHLPNYLAVTHMYIYIIINVSSLVLKERHNPPTTNANVNRLKHTQKLIINK